MPSGRVPWRQGASASSGKLCRRSTNDKQWACRDVRTSRSVRRTDGTSARIGGAESFGALSVSAAHACDSPGKVSVCDVPVAWASNFRVSYVGVQLAPRRSVFDNLTVGDGVVTMSCGPEWSRWFLWGETLPALGASSGRWPGRVGRHIGWNQDPTGLFGVSGATR